MRYIEPSLEQFTADAVRNLGMLNQTMKNRCMSAYEVARRTGIEVTTVKMYAKNRMLPTVKNYNKLARVFGWEAI